MCFQLALTPLSSIANVHSIIILWTSAISALKCKLRLNGETLEATFDARFKVWTRASVSRSVYRRSHGISFTTELSQQTRELLWLFSSRAAASPPKNSIAFQSVLVRYSLGMPETSLSGRNTRIARNVRRSISRCMPCENAVRILPQKHTHPATLYYLLLYYTNTYATLKYLYYVH